MSETIIGIDLGTTHSLVGAVEGGFPLVLADSANARLLPSAVYWPEDGEVLVGSGAMHMRGRDPGRVITSVKRLIGRRAGEMPWHAPYPTGPLPNGRLGVVIGKQTLSPEVVSARILARLKEIAGERLGRMVSKAVITVPAYFGEAQRAATKLAGELAGLEVVRILNEPTAAALAYGQDRVPGRRRVAVYDFGGGTFDMSVLELNDGVFQVLATCGDTLLGGDDLDGALAAWIWETGGFGEWDTSPAIPRDRVLMAARTAKEKLSVEATVQVEIPFLINDRHLVLEVSRVEFEALAAPWISRTINLAARAVADAGIDTAGLDATILVGGSTRIPAVRAAVAAWCGKPPDISQNPDEAVAKGAVIQAGILEGTLRNTLLLDVTPLSLGIETIGGLMNVLIPRNSTIPCKAGEMFTNAVPNQSGMAVRVLQGERELAKDNWELGRMRIGFAPLPRGQARVGVQFAIDADGLLTVLARDTLTGSDTVLEIKDSAVDVADSKVEEMISGSIDHAFDDMRARVWAEAKLKADELLPAVADALAMLEPVMNEGEAGAIREAAAAVDAALASGDPNRLKQAVQILDTRTEAMAAMLVEKAMDEALRNKGIG